MWRAFLSARMLLLAGCALLGTTTQSSSSQVSATPAATTSSDCPAPETDTHHFLAQVGVAVRTPRGAMSLIPVTQEATRERGLMCVVRIPPGRGMIFVFAPPDRMQGFWMKNTLVALDMVFVAHDGTVTSVAANVPATPAGTPDDAVARRQGLARFVIELGAGEAARHGIVHGTKLELPTLTAK